MTCPKVSVIFVIHSRDNASVSLTEEFLEIWRLRVHVCLVKSQGHDGIVYTSQTDLLSSF